MKDILKRDLILGETVAHILRGSTRVTVRLGRVELLDPAANSIIVRWIDNNKQSRPINPRNILALREGA